MKATLSLLALTLVAGSRADQGQSVHRAPAPPVPKLLARTKATFTHLIWTKDGNQVLTTDRATGVMKRVLATGIRTIHSVRLKYEVSRLIGIETHENNLYALVARITVPDGNKTRWFIKKAPDRVSFELHEISPADGSLTRSQDLKVDWVANPRSDQEDLPRVQPDALAGPLSVEDGRLQLFGKDIRSR